MDSKSQTVHRVRVAEDDPDIQRVIRLSLRFGGVEEAIVTGDGEECLAVVHRTKPDLILLDVSMPNLDGYQTCRMLKANPETQSIPVIFLTANVQDHEAEIGMNAGALGYLGKSFDLHEKITSILAKSVALEHS